MIQTPAVTDRRAKSAAPRRRREASTMALLAGAAGCLLGAPPARALPQPAPALRPPPAMAEVGVDEAIGQAVPADLRFRDQEGRTRRLGELLGGGRPVLLTLAYFRCPMLCELVVGGLAQTLKRVEWQPGRDYQAVTVSVDPTDTPAKARLKQTAILQAIGQPAARAGWPFLVDPGGDQVARLARAVGFRYAHDPASGQYAHPAVAVVLTPEGRISRYLYGVALRPLDVRLAVSEAASGRVGGLVERVLLTCFRYDPSTRRYGFFVNAVLKGGSGLVVLAVGLGLALLVRGDRRRQRGPGGGLAARGRADRRRERRRDRQEEW